MVQNLFSYSGVRLVRDFWYMFEAAVVVRAISIGMYVLRDDITYRRSPETIDRRRSIRAGYETVFLVSRWFSFPQSSARTTTSRYGRHNNAWRNSGVESSLPPPCNDVTGKWNSRKPGHTHIVFAASSRADRRRTLFNSGLDAFSSNSESCGNRKGQKEFFMRKR